MPVILWALIMPSCWVIVILGVVKLALTSSSGYAVPPAPAPAAAAANPAASGFAAIMFAVLLEFWRACCFASVSPSQRCCPNLRRVPLPDL